MSLRVRHPTGVATIPIAGNSDQSTVNDLLQEIYAATNILPSRQSLKTGYPPRTLTLVPELPLSSLGLKVNDQIIVSELASGIAGVATAAATQSVSSESPSAYVGERNHSVNSLKTNPEYVNTDLGVLIHRVVPDDNSCLFSSVALIFEQDMSKAMKLREIVADCIRKDSETYNEAILGMEPSKYMATITKPSTWGGAIELSILASHYDTEIASIDVETGRIDHFTPKSGTSRSRCLVIYSGIHYDLAVLAPTIDAPTEWHQTIFPASATLQDTDSILIAAKALATKLRAKKAFTNTATFDLKCEQCGQGLKGEKEARIHAEQTGHVKFGEY